MCSLSVLSFISQLYLLPEEWEKEITQTALRYMHGPRMWLHGRGGHAFFQAEKDIGLKATPRCPAADGLSTCFRTWFKIGKNDCWLD